MAMNWGAVQGDVNRFEAPEPEPITAEFDRVVCGTQTLPVVRRGMQRDQEANRAHIRAWLDVWLTRR